MIVKLNVVDRNKLCLSKDALQDICSLASTEKARKLIKFVACQASGFSNKRTGQQYGIYNFSRIRNAVKNALQDEIRESVLKLASVQERARLESFGINVGQETESSTNKESENEPDEASFDVDLKNDDSGGEFMRCTTSEENGAFNEHVDLGETDDVGSGGGS